MIHQATCYFSEGTESTSCIPSFVMTTDKMESPSPADKTPETVEVEIALDNEKTLLVSRRMVIMCFS